MFVSFNTYYIMMFLYISSGCIILLCLMGLLREDIPYHALKSIAALSDTYNTFVLGISYHRDPYQFNDLFIPFIHVVSIYLIIHIFIRLTDEQEKKLYLLGTIIYASHTMYELQESTPERNTDLMLYI
jgi:hypothetical protein